MEERNVKISLDKAREWYNKGGELKEIALQAFNEKELDDELPTSWEEFCKMYPIKIDEWYVDSNSNLKKFICGARFSTMQKNVLPSKEAAEAHLAYMQLHQLRDCYRQGWLPDWSNDNQIKWSIFFDKNIFVVKPIYHRSHFLSFQSEEIARKFLNNFIELIKLAGDLI